MMDDCTVVPPARWLTAALFASLLVVGCDGLFADLDDLTTPGVADTGDAGNGGDAGPGDAGPVDDAGDTGPDADTDTEDVIEDPEPPEVRTHNVEELGYDGVTLRGEMTDLGTPPAIEHGFCVDTDPDFAPDDGQGDCIALGEPDGEGDFATHFEDFFPGAAFYVRAWAENDTGTVYGDIVEFQLDVAEIAGGNRFGCAIDDDGGLWCWGRNHRGQLGIGSDVYGTSTPQRVGDHRWKKVSASDTYACAIDTDDSLWCWGDDDEGQLGIDDGFGDISTTPQRVELDEDQPSEWRDVATGDEHSCAIDGDQRLWCWGIATNVSFFDGEFVHPALGLGEEDDGGHYTPQMVDAAGLWHAVAAGSAHSCAIDGAQQLWCWGDNTDGQLGGESTHELLPFSFAPVRVDSNANWISVTAGDDHTCGLDDEGEIHCWGDNAHGQLGIGDGSTSESSPTEIADVTTASWTEVSTRADHTCATTDEEQLYCWGAGTYGRLGIDGESDRFLPTNVANDDGWHTVAPGSEHTCAVDGRGHWQCWGLRPVGTSAPGPVALDGELDDIAAGHSHSCAIAHDSMWCWGHRDNFGMEGGTSETTHLQSPQEISLSIAGGSAITAGREHTCFIDVDDHAHCWGRGQEGQLGNFDTSDKSLPVEVSNPGSINGWTALAAGRHHTCGIDLDGQLWCWGQNHRGQLGVGSDTEEFTVPQQISFVGDDWSHVASDDVHTCAINGDDQLWCWGWNGHGQLGFDDDDHYKTSPQLIDAPSAWRDVAVGRGHTCGIDDDERLWCWGLNHRGQLGLGSTEEDEHSIAEPRHVDFSGGPSGWSEVFSRRYHTCGIDADDGDLWCWGLETSGQLGTGIAGQHHRPAKVIADPVSDHGDGWDTVSLGNHYTLALRDDGSAWSWGSNVFGQLGNDTAWRLVPGSIADF